MCLVACLVAGLLERLAPLAYMLSHLFFTLQMHETEGRTKVLWGDDMNVLFLKGYRLVSDGKRFVPEEDAIIPVPFAGNFHRSEHILKDTAFVHVAPVVVKLAKEKGITLILSAEAARGRFRTLLRMIGVRGRLLYSFVDALYEN